MASPRDVSRATLHTPRETGEPRKILMLAQESGMLFSYSFCVLAAWSAASKFVNQVSCLSCVLRKLTPKACSGSTFHNLYGCKVIKT